MIIVNPVLGSQLVRMLAVCHEIKTHQLIFLFVNTWDVGVIGTRNNILKFFTCEDINANKMNLGMSMFAGFRCRHVNNLAGPTLYHNMSISSQSRTCHWESQTFAIMGNGIL